LGWVKWMSQEVEKIKENLIFINVDTLIKMTLTVNHLGKYYDEQFSKKYGNSLNDLYLLAGVTTFAFITLLLISTR
jgi:hypothetical protein